MKFGITSRIRAEARRTHHRRRSQGRPQLRARAGAARAAAVASPATAVWRGRWRQWRGWWNRERGRLRQPGRQLRRLRRLRRRRRRRRLRRQQWRGWRNRGPRRRLRRLLRRRRRRRLLRRRGRRGRRGRRQWRRGRRGRRAWCGARNLHRIRARVGPITVDHELVAAGVQRSVENGLKAAVSAVIATKELARKVLRPHPDVRVEAGSARVERVRAPCRSAEVIDVVGSRIANPVGRPGAG